MSPPERTSAEGSFANGFRYASARAMPAAPSSVPVKNGVACEW